MQIVLVLLNLLGRFGIFYHYCYIKNYVKKKIVKEAGEEVAKIEIKELAKKEDRSIRSWMDIAIGDIYEQKFKELINDNNN